MTDGPKVRFASPREVFNIAILGEYLVADIRPKTAYEAGRVPCSTHIPATASREDIEEMKDEGDICADYWSTMVLYTEKSSPDDPDLNRMCQAFSEDDSVESIWILQGGYEAFLSYYGSRVCQLEDDSVIYPAHIDDTYQIYLSGEYVSKQRQVFVDLGITHVLNVAREASMPFLNDKLLNLKYKHVALLDDESQDILSSFKTCIDFIDEALATPNGKVLVHCVEGRSRSPVVIAAYLVEKKNLSAAAAMAQLKRARPIVSPNKGFLHQLSVFEIKE